ncbi:MAG: beta-ketoacyl-ACP synthase 3 [Desulfovibrionaceae bacterium]
MYSSILSTGCYLPSKEVANEDLVQFPANARRLIQVKTGVKYRRYADREQTTSDLAALAAKDCLKKAGVEASTLDALIVATSSPDRMLPATAARTQALIGANNSFAFDINSVCSGGVFALHVADSLIKSGAANHVLVVAAELYSRILNPNDFTTKPYFGDGSGAVLLGRGSDSGSRVIGSLLRTDGNKSEVITVPAGGVMMPFSEITTTDDIYFRMNGREVFDFAIRRGSEVISEAADIFGFSMQDVACVVPHQANINIINELANNTGIPRDRFFVNLERYGNTGGASTLIAMHEVFEHGELEKESLLLVVAFGGGLSWGINVIRT